MDLQNIKSEEPDLFYFDTSGYSMWPFLREHERIIVKKIPVEYLNRGDIILYRSGNQLICHRLIKKNRTTFFTRGDNSVSGSVPIDSGMYAGKVIGVVRWNRIINLGTKRQRFISCIIMIIAPVVSLLNRKLKPVTDCLKTHVFKNRERPE